MEYKVNTIAAKTPSAVGTILTGITDYDSQFPNIEKWRKAASYIRVCSHKRGQETGGLRFVKPQRAIPGFREVLGEYAVQIPGNSTFAVVCPDVILASDLTKVFQHAKDMRYETWAAGLYAYDDKGVIPSTSPRAFIATTSVLPYLLQEVPEKLNFSSEAWAAWLHEWFHRALMKPRYFIIPNMVTLPEAESPVLNAYEMSPAPSTPPVPDNAPESKETAAPVKRTRGRSKSK